MAFNTLFTAQSPRILLLVTGGRSGPETARLRSTLEQKMGEIGIATQVAALHVPHMDSTDLFAAMDSALFQDESQRLGA